MGFGLYLDVSFVKVCESYKKYKVLVFDNIDFIY